MNTKKPKNLEKLSEIVENIKVVEAEIKKIDKLASILANNPCMIDFTMKVEDLKAKEEERSKVEFDEDGSIVEPNVSDIGSEMVNVMMGWGGAFRKPEQKKYIKSYSSVFSENLSLKVLSLIINEKKEEYAKLVIQLNDLKL